MTSFRAWNASKKLLRFLDLDQRGLAVHDQLNLGDRDDENSRSWNNCTLPYRILDCQRANRANLLSCDSVTVKCSRPEYADGHAD